MFRLFLASQLQSLVGSNVQVALMSDVVEGTLLSVNSDWIRVLTSTTEYENEQSTNFIPLNSIQYFVEL